MKVLRACPEGLLKVDGTTASQQGLRIHGSAVEVGLEVEMTGGRGTGGPGVPDQLPAFDAIPVAYGELGEVVVTGQE